MRTPAQLRRRYTTTTKLCGKWYTFLNVGVQSFHIVGGTTKKRAKWFADRVAGALAKVIQENQP